MDSTKRIRAYEDSEGYVSRHPPSINPSRTSFVTRPTTEMKKGQKKPEACGFKSMCGGLRPSVMNIANALFPDELWKCSQEAEGALKCEIPRELGIEEGAEALVCSSHANKMHQIAIRCVETRESNWNPLPLTVKEVNGTFANLSAFSSPCATSSTRSSQKWLEIRMSGTSANELGGEQTTRLHEFITLSCFLLGYSEVDKEGEQLAFLYFPCLKAQAEVSVAWVDGVERAWQVKHLTSTRRGQIEYRDGQTDDGLSMFTPARKVSLAERAAAVAGLEEAADAAQFVSPVKTRPIASTTWDKDWTEYTSENLFGTEGKTMTDSPGKHPHPQVLMFSAGTVSEEMPAPDVGTRERDILDRCFQLPAGATCMCGRLVKGDGTAACACGLVFNTAGMVKSRYAPAQATNEVSSSAERLAALNKKFEAVYAMQPGPENNQSPRKEPGGGGSGGGSGPGGSGGPGGGPGGGGDDDAEGIGLVSGNSGPSLAELQATLRLARAALFNVLESDRYAKIKQNEAAIKAEAARQNAATMLRQTGGMLALAMTDHQDFLLRQERSAQLHTERLARELAADALLVEVKKKEAEKFPLGCVQLVKIMQEAGRHGDMTGANTKGNQVHKQIGVNATTMAATYRAVMGASFTPDTAQAFLHPVTQQLVYNVLTGNVGAAPLPKGVVATFQEGASIYDFKREPMYKPSTGTVSWNLEVPTKKSIKFVSDIERAKQQFGDIYELEDAMVNYATMLAMIFGPAWYEPIKDCGRRLRELHFSDPRKYHLTLVVYLANLGIRHSWQMSGQLASNPDFMPSQEQRSISQHLGFATQAFIPGDGFFATGDWMEQNLRRPFEEDVRAMLSLTMGTCSVQDRIAASFSATPHFAVPQQVGATRHKQVRVGYDEADEASSHEQELEGWPAAIEWQPLGGPTAVSRAERAQPRAEGGKSGGKGDAGRRDGKGGRGAAVAPMVRIARHHVQEGFQQLPNTVDPKGEPAGVACLRALCHPPKDKHGARIPGLVHNCPANCPAHPLHRPGSTCGRSHFPVDPTEKITWSVRAISLTLGGLRSEPEPPSDPVKLQAIADTYIANATNRVPLQAMIAPSTRQTTLGWTGTNGELVVAAYGWGTHEEEDDYPVGESGYLYGEGDHGCWEDWESEQLGEQLGDGSARSDHRVEWKQVPGSQLPRGCQRVGELKIPYLPYQFLVFDLGGRCPSAARAGNKNCLLSTLGALFQKYGYDTVTYLESAKQEFDRQGVVDRPEYSAYATLLRSTDFLLLHMVVHMGVPDGVALVIVCSRPGVAPQLVVFTCGKPKVVEFAFISKKHIMPMAHALSPFRPTTWADFTGAIEPFKSHGGQVAIKHTSRKLPLLVNVSLGQVTGSCEVGSNEVEEVGGSSDEEELNELMTRELGMIDLSPAERGECQELMRNLQAEIQAFMTHLGAGLKLNALASATVFKMLSIIRKLDDSVWTEYPLLLAYYVRRITLCGYAAQECDQQTLRFLDKLWERAEGGYPFPHFFKSVVWQMLEGADGSVAVGLFRELAKGHLSLQDAAVMVALNLHGNMHGEGEPSPRVKQYLSEGLEKRYGSLESDCKSVLQMNVWCGSLDEYRERVECGHTVNQSLWLEEYVIEYARYLDEQTGRDGFFSVFTMCAEGEHTSLKAMKKKYAAKKAPAKKARLKRPREEGPSCSPAAKVRKQDSPGAQAAIESVSKAESESEQSELNLATQSALNMAESLQDAKITKRKQASQVKKNASGLSGYTGYAICTDAEAQAAEEASNGPRNWRTNTEFADLRYKQRELTQSAALQQSGDGRQARAARADAVAWRRQTKAKGDVAKKDSLIDLTDEDDESMRPSRSQSTKDLPGIQETAEEVISMAMESLVSPDTLEREVLGVANGKPVQGQPIEQIVDANAAKGAAAVNSDVGAKQVANMSVEASESEDEVQVVFVPEGNQAFGPPLSPTVPKNHEESLYLMSLGEEVSNERNKGSGPKMTSEREAAPTVKGSELEDDEGQVSGLERTQTFEPPLVQKVPGDHEESLFLMALGEQVSNERNKASGVKVTSKRGATATARVSEGNDVRRTLTLVEQALDTSQSCAGEAEDELESVEAINNAPSSAGAAYRNSLSESEEQELVAWEERQRQKRLKKAETVLAESVADMLRDDSPEIWALRPFVLRLQQATAELKAAIVSPEPAGELKRKSLQDAYLKASNKLCHAAERACNNRWWPQLFLAAYRSTHPGRVNPNVDPEYLRQAFEGLISPEVLRVIVAQAKEGQEIYLSRAPEASWPRETPTAKMYADEIWRTIWIDAAHESTFVFGPECIPAMNKAQMQGYPLHRIPKKNTSTGEATTKGRLIADLSAANEEGHSINSTTLLDHYPTFRMPGHADVARDVLLLRHWFPKMEIVISKLDVARAFRQKMLSIGSFGVLAFRLSGHTCVDQAFVFGLSSSPSVYASTSQAIHEAHNACSVHFTGQELRDYGYSGYDRLSDKEKTEGISLKFFSYTYCDDGILVAIKTAKYMEATMNSYKHFMIAALGPDAVSDKDPEEQEWSQVKTVIGHRFSLGEVPDARGCVDFLCPTPQRIALMTLVMSDIQFTPNGKDILTAGLCAKAFSLWLWMCIPCPRCKAFIGSFKRVFEGKTQWTAADIVTPVRKGDDPTTAWQMFWEDMLTLKTILLHHARNPGFFKVPLFRLLREEEQLIEFRSWFKTIATDASMLGGGGFCYEGPYAGHFFRVPFPAWVIRDIKKSMAEGHGNEGSWMYTIAVAEKAMHSLGLILYGEAGGCCAMLQDNQNVVDWVQKGWGKPTRVQNYLRWDVMVAQSRDMWAAIEYIHTSLNTHADLLSRSFNEDGSDKPDVIAEFHEEVRTLGLVATETIVPECLLRELLPEMVGTCDLSQLERYASESWGMEQCSSKSRVEETVKLKVGRGSVSESVALAVAKNCSQWRSPQDEGSDDDLMRMQLGGRSWTDVKNTKQRAGRQDREVAGKVTTRRGEEDESSSEPSIECEVERVLNTRMHGVHGHQYRVKWVGYSNVHNRWVRERDCNSQELIAAFEARREVMGDPEEKMTDAQAETFYYGVATGKVVMNEAAHSVSVGPGTVPWVRPPQEKRTLPTNDTAMPVVEPESNRVTYPVFRPRQGEPYGRSVFRDEVAPKNVSTSMNYPGQEFSRQSAEKGGKGNKGGKAAGGFGRTGEQSYSQSTGRGAEYANVYRGILGPSLEDKIEQASLRTGRRRVEVYIEPNNDRLRQVAALTLAHSLAKNTRQKYNDNFRFFLDFCERQQVSPILDGSDRRREEATLIEYILYEYDIHGNKYSTLKLKLSAIRSAMMEEGYPNPLENKMTLARHMKGIKTLRGATDAKEPLPAAAFRHILEQTETESLFVRAAALAIVIAFFFLLRIGEFAARDRRHMDESILLRQDVTFFCKGRLCAWHHPKVDAVEVFIRGSKTDQRKQGCRRVQYLSEDATLCPIKCMVEWFALTEGSHIPASAPLFSVPKGKEGVEWTVLTREAVTLLMKGAAADFDLQPKWVATHSIRISGATALLMAGVPPETVQIMGRWVSNAFIGYTRYQAELMAGISKRMVGTHYVVRPR